MKAVYELTVQAPADWTVVSNMAAEAEGGVDAGDGTRSWHFPPTPLMATYITHVSAGPWHVVRSEHDGIPLGIFCRQSLARYLDPDEIFEVTRQGFDFYHQAFGIKYPFGKYDQLFVPEFKEGAMENAGRGHLPRGLRLQVAGHRLLPGGARRDDPARDGAHVVRRPGHHALVGRPVAERVVRHLGRHRGPGQGHPLGHSWTTFTTAWKAWACKQDQLPSTHPIAADIPDIHAVEVNFDGITYAKGAAVLKQLVAYVGYDNFLAGVRKYFAAHSYGNATLADLLSALEETSGRDLGAWSREWLETAGVNTLRPSYSLDGDGRFTAFSVLQSAAPSHPTLRSHRVAIGLYSLSPEGLVRVSSVETDVTGDWTPVPELVGVPRPDLVLINDEDLTYAKIRLDPHSLRTAVSSIGSFTSSLPAALVWAAAWDMVRDGEMAARDYVRLVLGGVDSVKDISVVQTLVRQAILAARQYADPSWRAEGLAFIASSLRSLCAAAPAGSDHQLAYVRAFTTVATSPEDLEFLAGLFDGTVEPRRARGRHRPALGAAAAPGQPGRAGRGRHRRGAVKGRHRRRRAAGRRVPCGGTDTHGQARDLGDADRREADDRDVPGHGHRVRRPGPAGARPPVPAGVLRRAREGVARVVLGDGTGLRGVRLPDLSRWMRRRSRPPTPTWPPSPHRPPRCGACSPRAATRSPAPCVTSPATARRRANRSQRTRRPGRIACRAVARAC